LARRKLPPTVWALGIVNLFKGISPEIVHSLLPVFLANVPGRAPDGWVDRGGDKGDGNDDPGFSGSISDWLGKRKILALTGYSLGTLS